jgi:hypoxanthine phosphoribosyltransferase
MRGDLEKVLFDEPAIHRRLDDMATQISNDYRDRELTVIAVLHGSLMFVADLLRRIPLPLKLDCLSVASYRGKLQSSGEIVFKLATASPSGGAQITLPDVAGRDILVLDDILDSGFTLAAVRETLENSQTAQHSDMRAVEQKETTRPRGRCRLRGVQNRRRICSRLRARF